MTRVGILAIQGDVAAHRRSLERLGARVTPVLFERDLDAVDALVIPGGESTTMAKGLTRLELYAPLQDRIGQGLPVIGTCAGAILLARDVRNRPVRGLDAIGVTAVRNAYGTQVDSFAAKVDEGAADGLCGLRCVFIRAPQLKDPAAEVEVLARVEGRPVLVRQANVMAATFHPELTDDPRVHSLLLDIAARDA